jgi:indole-3-glycerol phosphate synthase
MPPARLKELLATVEDTGMAALVEIHDERELEAALAAGASFLGINNRNLADFSVDLGTSFSILRKCPKDTPVVSESGIFTREDAGKLREAGACAILVGEAFMVQPDVEAAVRALMPEN